MYNRAPCESTFDPFFVEHHQPRPRRRLRQVASYHDLDDVPTVPTHPDTKGRAGCNDTMKRRSRQNTVGSPSCVADVKHFDSAIVGDDIGGVSIDLCLPENDPEEEDELFFLHEQQEALFLQCDDPERRDEAKAEELPMDQEPSLRPRTMSAPPSRLPATTSSRSRLAPVFEERNVTFAAQHVVLRVDDDEMDDHLSIDHQRLVHQVFDAVQVWSIPHHTEYAEKVRASLWYNHSEMAAMKERAAEFRKSHRRQERRSQTAKQPKDHRETCSLFPFDRPAAATDTSSQNLTLSSHERRSLYESMVDAVLLEQYEQRRKCLRVYGRVGEGFSGILDFDRLAEVCSRAGDTLRSQERAVRRAALGESSEEEDDDDDDDELTPTSTPRDSLVLAAPVRGKPNYNHHHRHSKRSHAPRSNPSFHSSAITVETSQIVDRSIAAIFRTILSPFLEIRRGDLFLGVGEEMSIPVA